MSLLKYFRKKEEARCQKLPDPCGPLGQEVGEKLTEEANREVALVLESQAKSSTRGSTKRDPYLKVTSEQKAIVAKYAAEHGVARAIRKFSKEFGSTLKESTIRENHEHMYRKTLQCPPFLFTCDIRSNTAAARQYGV